MTAMLCKKTVTQATKAGRPRTFRFRLSDGTADRDRDRLAPRGWRLSNFARNPVILWAHDHKTPAIAKASNLTIEGQGERAALMGDAIFPPPGIHPLADQIHDLIDAGIIASCSVGFTPIHSEPNELGGTDFLEQELNEISVVNVGALPSALLVGRANIAAVEKWLGTPSPPLSIVGDPSEPRVRADNVILRVLEDRDLFHVDKTELRATVQQTVLAALVGAVDVAVKAALDAARGKVR